MFTLCQVGVAGLKMLGQACSACTAVLRLLPPSGGGSWQQLFTRFVAEVCVLPFQFIVNPPLILKYFFACGLIIEAMVLPIDWFGGVFHH
jgi:hypothetical protein